jgi:SAM-dependent methyltransferase
VDTKLIAGTTARDVWRRGATIARSLQDEFVRQSKSYLGAGDVIEIGGERKRDHQRFFNERRFVLTNISGDCDELVDCTNIDRPDNSIDNILCVSVLEHVPDPARAVVEMKRVLKPGGVLILCVPFMYSIHDSHDFWRMTPETLRGLTSGLRVEVFAHLGGRTASAANLLIRSATKSPLRSIVCRALALVLLGLFARSEEVDDSPLLIGIVGRKDGSPSVESSQVAL